MRKAICIITFLVLIFALTSCSTIKVSSSTVSETAKLSTNELKIETVLLTEKENLDKMLVLL